MRLDESHIARRRFLCGMAGGGTAALATIVAAPLGSYLGNCRDEPPPAFVELPQSQYELAPGTSKLVMYGRIPALVVRTPLPQGELRILVATCTHFDCIVGYQPGENRIFCACHEGLYDVDGNVVSGPPPRPLRPFHFQVREGKLLIALEKENLEKAIREAEA
ncbi:MAG: Rieske 2Fe-2S domain-containing protein, partial [Pirellulales bacterium]|nr:Rieske 2Fe-2S domain-containing protein [Pirellulales bacterium]